MADAWRWTKFWGGKFLKLFAAPFRAKGDTQLSLGEHGENLAVRFLRRCRYRIIERNYREQFGEIDLIAVDQRTVVFVEVKTRTSTYAGDPADAVDERKQQKIAKTALAYLKMHRLLEHSCRFDIVTVLILPDQEPEIQHYESAFRLDDINDSMF